jgi:hypothetical protein
MGCNFSLKFRGPYVKIHRQWSFRVDCYEIRDPFWEVMDCKYIFSKSLGVRMKILGPRA